MSSISNILFPVDFSPSSLAMAPYVKRAAILAGAKVSLIHVFDPVSHSGFELYLRAVPEIAVEHQNIARERLDSFLSDEFPASECTRILVAGDAATQIAHAARNGFDLIIMPTHSGFFRRMLLGSTTAKVLNDADCPVLTSMHAETIAPRPPEHKEWLCAVGSGHDSERVLRFAHKMSKESAANLTIIHAIQSEDAISPARLDLEEQVQSAERQEAHRHIADLQKRVGTDLPVHIAVGTTKDALVEAASRTDADVLFIGRGPQSGALGRLRDLTYTVVRDAPFPVLSV